MPRTRSLRAGDACELAFRVHDDAGLLPHGFIEQGRDKHVAARLGKGKAIRATAHKLARLIYTLMTKGEQYVDQGQDYFEAQHQQRVMRNLKKKALAMGFSLTPIEAVAA